MFKLLCVTNRNICEGDFLERIDAIGKGEIPRGLRTKGPDVVGRRKPDALILREKDLSEAEYERLAGEVLAVCGRNRLPCILHGFPDAAKKLGHPAIHLPLAVLRELAAEDRRFFTCLGASCHSVGEAREAEALGCTYITAGHIFETDCKSGLPGRGLEFLSAVCESVSVPVYAIGGIGRANIDAVRRTGAAGACSMSGFMQGDGRMNFHKENLLLYAVTDRAWAGEQPFCRQVEAALKGGVTMVQLREKNLEEGAFLEEALAIGKLCHSYGVPLIINDNVRVAKKSGADGVHVGAGDMPVAGIRQEMGSRFIIGATAKTVKQARAAEAAGADYLGVGAVFPSPTKADAVRVTKEQLKEIRNSVKIPVVAIGGIGHANMGELYGSGADGVAAVSAIFAQENIEEAARALKRKAVQVLGKGEGA